MSSCSFSFLQAAIVSSRALILMKVTDGLASSPQEKQGTLPDGKPRTLCNSSRWGPQRTWPSGQTYTDGGSASSVQLWHRKDANRSSTAWEKGERKKREIQVKIGFFAFTLTIDSLLAVTG